MNPWRHPPFLGFPDIFWTRKKMSRNLRGASCVVVLANIAGSARSAVCVPWTIIVADSGLVYALETNCSFFPVSVDCTRIGRNCCVACKGTSGGDWFRCGRNIKTGDTKMKPMLHIWRQNGEKPIEPTKAWADWAEIATCPVADFGRGATDAGRSQDEGRQSQAGVRWSKVESKKFWIDCMSHKGNSRCLVVVASFKRAQGRSGVSSAGWCFLGPYCSSQSLGAPAPRSLVG